MDWLQFFSSMTSSLAWPIATVTIVLLLRMSVVKLLPRLRHFKYKDIEAQFSDGLKEVEDEASKLPIPTLPAPISAESSERFNRILEASPSYAVLEAWLQVEAALQDLASQSELNIEKRSPTFQILRQLRHQGILDDPTYAALKDLRSLRNLAVHPQEDLPITAEQAIRYKDLADQVIGAIRSTARPAN
ncbi:hypothetical protein [Rhodopseudomonas palustris]|uniref:hypothetical protein n=1 Tax=Rhodopseudomonas palustris TaxID=1076 RepID=UPI001057E51B|nr:hypothetical protein [Rhodopseudomonas palustris]